MHKMRTVGADETSFSGQQLNKKGGRRSATFNIPDGAPGSNHGSVQSSGIHEITLDVDVGDNSLAVKSVETAGGGAGEEKSLSLERNASSRIQPVSEEPERLTSFSKRQPVGRLERTKSAAAPALTGLKFISKNDGGSAWAALENRFDELTATTDGLLPRSLFGQCIGMDEKSRDFDQNKKEKSKDFAGELFDSLSRRRNITGYSINKAQLKEFWDQIADQSFDSRLQTFFDMVDKDGDGRITEDEVVEIIRLSASANKLQNIQNQADEYAALFMEELDPDNLGYIMIETLEMLLLRSPTHDASGESKILSHKLSQKLKSIDRRNSLRRRWYEDLKYFLQDNWQRCWVIMVWILVMVGLFTWKYIQYKHRAVYDVMGSCVCIAKGAAETLKLNMAIILLPVCRNTITLLRNKTRLGVVLPFNDNLKFHQMIAVAIMIGVGLHAISHLTCDFPRLIHATEEEYKPMQQYFGDQAKNYWHFMKEVEGYTGIIMVVLMTIAFTLATPWLRRKKLNLPSFLNKLTGFNAFWYSHHLFVVVYVMLIVHGIKLYLTKEWYKKTTWMYLAVPVSLYACERLIRAFRSNVKPVKILEAPVYPGKVLSLRMSKPKGFKYKSGQYVFVKCPAVSPFEWHPFSITSAPRDDYISVHIRTLGDWTEQLKKVFEEVCQPPRNGQSGLLRADCQGETPNYPKVLIDGPYGAPAQDYKEYEVVLLVGLGIGATPMISIVKDIANNMKAKEEEESEIENGGTPQKNNSGPTTANNFKTTRAYFYWVTREQGSFEWFKGILDEVGEMDKYDAIEMHTYCTSVYEEGDARSALITMLQSINHAKNGVDVVSGTRVKSHFAKPNWRNVYESIAQNHPGSRIGVFYCGAPAPTKELKHLALDLSHKTSTKFDFHKENF